VKFLSTYLKVVLLRQQSSQNLACTRNVLVGSVFDFSRHLARRGNGESHGRLFHPFSFASIHTILDPGACLEAIALLVLSGCTRLQVRLGSKVHLGAVPVKSMDARLAKAPGIVPGQKSSLVVVITDADGKVLQTEGAGQGKVLWSDLKGVVSLPRDPRISDGKMPHVTITVPSHPNIRAELDIPVRYDYNFISNFSGSSGSSGFNGTDGLDGTSGSIGSIDPNNPSPGGNGSDGTNGSNGQDGGRGENAPPVQIRVAL
jgi:hypothetical protein